VTGDREQALVELVSPHGEPIGSASVHAAHDGAGLLHRAFSVLLFDEQGRTLVQQRAAAKTRFPLRWANSCCGHPAPAEDLTAAAARRLDEELGIRGVELTAVGVYTYTAADSATGRTEREYDHVVIGRVRSDIAVRPDPDEVAAVQWLPAAELLDDGDPAGQHAPWLHGVLSVALNSPVLIDVARGTPAEGDRR
jgi:isopentenyl-diphosphate delta-isomerase